jgi:hypothetical protein
LAGRGPRNIGKIDQALKEREKIRAIRGDSCRPSAPPTRRTGCFPRTHIHVPCESSAAWWVSSWGSVRHGRTPPQASTEVGPSALKNTCRHRNQGAANFYPESNFKLALTKRHSGHSRMGAKRRKHKLRLFHITR